MAEFACIAMRGYSVCRDLVCALFVDLHWPSLHPFICNVFDFFIRIVFALYNICSMCSVQ